MTQIVLEHSRSGTPGGFREMRFQIDHGTQQVESQLPPKPAALDECCPHCQQFLPTPSRNAFQRLRAGLRQLLLAVPAIIFAVLRIVRLVVALALSFVGVLGFGVHRLGQKIVHPDDQRLLPHSNRDHGS